MALASHSTANVAQALSGINFPANKQQLIEHAQKKQNVDQELIKVLEQMPDEQYTSMADVFKGVGMANA